MSQNCHHNLWGAAKSHFIKNSIYNNQNLLIITENAEVYSKTLNEIKFFFPNNNILGFPEYTQEPFETARVLPEIMAKRAQCLYKLSTTDNNIIVTTFYALIKTLPNREDFLSSIFEIKKGSVFAHNELIYYLDILGYVPVEIVSGPGEYSIRGEITDIFPIQNEAPVRMEFFDDEIDYIFEYNLETQLKKTEITEFLLLPASELLLDLNELIKNTDNYKLKENFETFGKFAGYHWYPPNNYGNKSSLFDYFKTQPDVCILSDDFRYKAEQMQLRIEDAISNADFDVNVSANFFDPIKTFKNLIEKKHYFLKEISSENCKAENYGSVKTILHKPVKNIYESLSIFYESIKPYTDYKIVLAVSSSKFRNLITDFFKDYQIVINEAKSLPDKNGVYIYK